MNYDNKEETFDLIIIDIEVNNMPINKVLAQEKMPSTSTFYKWLEDDEEKAKRYARACEARQENKFNEILEIADNDDDIFYDEQGNKRIDAAHVQKKRLQIDARKWQLSKENPKKYGDKLDVSSEVKQVTQIVLTDATTNTDS